MAKQCKNRSDSPCEGKASVETPARKIEKSLYAKTQKDLD